MVWVVQQASPAEKVGLDCLCPSPGFYTAPGWLHSQISVCRFQNFCLKFWVCLALFLYPTKFCGSFLVLSNEGKRAKTALERPGLYLFCMCIRTHKYKKNKWYKPLLFSIATTLMGFIYCLLCLKSCLKVRIYQLIKKISMRLMSSWTKMWWTVAGVTENLDCIKILFKGKNL